MKDPRTEEPKAQSPELFFAHHHLKNERLNRKSHEKAHREKMKKRRCQKQP